MTSVSLVCMPWHMLAPSTGVASHSHSLHLAFEEYLLAQPPRHRLELQEYEDVCSTWGNHGVGDWMFAVAPAREASPASDLPIAPFPGAQAAEKAENEEEESEWFFMPLPRAPEFESQATDIPGRSNLPGYRRGFRRSADATV